MNSDPGYVKTLAKYRELETDQENPLDPEHRRFVLEASEPLLHNNKIIVQIKNKQLDGNTESKS